MARSKLQQGINDVATKFPSLALEWSATNLKTPENTLPGSRENIEWICQQYQHVWKDTVNHRTSGRGCPYCSHKRLLTGFNDLETIYPDLVKQWSSKNLLPPNKVFASSGKKYWWVCSQGHEWEATTNNRRGGTVGCPYCSNQKVLLGYNDLHTLFPEIAEELVKISDTLISAYSTKKYKWQCQKNKTHVWITSVRQRTVHGSGCPFCAGQQVLVGSNDLTMTAPWVEKFQPTPSPHTLTSNSGRKISLTCSKGHTWSPYVFNLSRREPGCPICRGSGPSKPERDIVDFLSKHVVVFPQHKILYNNNQKRLFVDVFFEYGSVKYILEYDGEYWHRNLLLKDTFKTNILLSQGYTVIRIREHPLPLLDIQHENLIQLRADKFTEVLEETLSLTRHSRPVRLEA